MNLERRVIEIPEELVLFEDPNILFRLTERHTAMYPVYKDGKIELEPIEVVQEMCIYSPNTLLKWENSPAASAVISLKNYDRL